MPLSEFLRMVREKIEPGQQRPCPTNLSSRSDGDLVELVWENGQIMMQGQSSRPARSPTHKIRDARVGHATAARIGKFGVFDSVLNDMSPVVPSGDLDFGHDDEIVPWLSYPIDDALAQDYGSQLLPEISGVTGNGMSAQNSFLSVDKRSNCEQTVGNLHNGGNTLKGSSSFSGAHLLGSWPPQHRQTSDVLGSRDSEIVSNNTSNCNGDAMFGNPTQGRDTVNNCKSVKMGRQGMGQPNSDDSNLLNFSNFSRPAAALVKPNQPNCDAIPNSVSPSVVRMEVKEKGSAATCSNPVKSNVIGRFNGTGKEIGLHVSSPIRAVVNSKVVKAAKGPCPPERTVNLCQESCIKNDIDRPLIPSNTANSVKVVPDSERTVEPMVASSSVGSGNSADRVSCEKTHNSKRKFRDIEESECHSDDIETESLGVKRPTSARRGAGSKRSRAAEVHNLSERRRRDRINEKMRALQELIPNCNKADKASMLDEAIEYLKTLQLQVQIMSMGAGLCMPPMMFPTGMQRMHPAHVSHFSPMGVGMGMGMGMGMGFGMGMLDMNGGGSSGCPIFPMPPMQLPHFPCPMPGPTNFQRIPGPTFPVYPHPGQGIPNSVPSALRSGSQNEVPSTSPILNHGDAMTNANSPLMCNAEAGSSINHKSNQMQAINHEVLDQSSAMQENKQATDVRGPAALTCTTATDTSKDQVMISRTD